MPRYSKVNISEAVDMYTSGSTIEEIAKHFKADKGTVKKKLIDGGATILSDSEKRMERLRISLPKEKLSYMYVDQGMNISEIVDELGHSRKFITDLLKEYSIRQRTASEEAYKGNKYINSKGYVIISGYDEEGRYYRTREHIYIMEQHLGRKLNDDEVVHHKDENKANNDLSNLQLMTKKEHDAYHLNMHKRKT